MDVKKSFLNGYLHEGIYVVQSRGFEDPEHTPWLCVQTKESIVWTETIQASHALYEQLTQYLLKLGYHHIWKQG